MALLKIEGFDHLSTAQLARKWETVLGNMQVITPGRFGGRCLQFNDAGTASYIQQSFVDRSTFFVGVAFSAAYGDSAGPLITFLDDGTNQVDVRITSDAAIQFTRNGTPIATSATNRFAFGFFNYLEVQVTISNTVGVVIARMNGNQILNEGSLDTQNTANNTVNQVRFSPFTNAGSYDIRFDDIYICDSSGVKNNTLLGETRVETHYPEANGSVNNFIAYGAGTNWQAVSESVSDDDASFTQSGTIGDRDLFDMGDHDFVGEIFGVQLSVTHRKDDVGSRTIAPLLKTDTEVEYEGDEVSCLSAYQMTTKVWEVYPPGAADWTPATVNSTEFGIIIKG